MPLENGSRLGPYEIDASIGKGGMGEVYKARDSRVGRDVAVKVSSEQFSERFEREARAIAALNHPNICTLYDVGPSYLVMEYIEGESPKGPMALEDALRIADQIAAALEAAHERGIVHRDLKPGNIKIRPDGTVKVLDFGLAKVGGTAAASSYDSPTMSLAATQAGMVLGTAAYMSPEQARGKNVDHRSDIWAFGVVLYELLTGKRLFDGEDVTEVLASVVKEKPDLSVIPSPVRTLLEACLQKDPAKRLQAIGDRRFLLRQPEAAVPLHGTRRMRWLWPSVAAALAFTAALAFWAPWRKPETQTVRFELDPPSKSNFTNWMLLSPDGRKVAFTARREDGGVRLWVRPLDSLEATEVATTGSNPVPFWSFDNRSIAYQYNGKLMRVDGAGGPAQVLCDADGNFMGGTWNRDNVIIFGGPDGLQRVAASGGTPQKLTRVDSSRGENGHAAPVFLPDRRHFIYQRRSSQPSVAGIYVGSLDLSPEQQSTQPLLLTEMNALFVSTRAGDRLLFLRETALMAQPFDAGKLTLSGEAMQIANPVGRMNAAFINAMVSEDGTLIYRTGGLADIRKLVWYDRKGAVLQALPETGVWTQVAISRDGTRAAAQKLGENGNRDLFIVDLMKGLFTRFTFDKGVESDPVFSPDGSKIVFATDRDGGRNLYIKASNGATNEELLLKSSDEKTPTDWSRDGRYLIYSQRESNNSAPDLWILPMPESGAKDKPESPRVFLPTPFAEDQAKISPDGRFVAYRSNESGRPEIYVRSFPDGNGRWQISNEGGAGPRWRPDGKELFFTGPNLSLMAVDASLGPTVQFGVPHRLFVAKQTVIMDTADGQRFLWAETLDDQVSSPIIVVLHALTAH